MLRDQRYWRARAASAQVAPAPSGEEVAIGCWVTFEREGTRKTVTIVGHDEGEPAAGLVAFTAPLIKAMLGAEVGDEVEVPGGVVTVVAIEVT